MKELTLHLDIEPLAVQSLRFARCGSYIQKYQPKKNVEYKACIRVLTLNQLKEDFKLFSGALKIEANFIFTLPKNSTKKTKELIAQNKIVYKSTRPDLHDNLLKATADALTGVIYNDDSQIVELHSRKYYGITPGITMKISEVEDAK